MSRIALSILCLAVASCGGHKRQVLTGPSDPIAEPGSGPGATDETAADSGADLVAVEPDTLPAGDTDDQPLSDGETDAELDPEPIAPQQATALPPHPLTGIDDAELESRLISDPVSLGPMSLGRPSSGALFNGRQMPPGPQWQLVSPRESWGTDETIDALVRCIGVVNQQFANTPRIHIGDISTRNGGYHAPHTSHQSGRDVDIGYYYTTARAWYTKATAKNLDLARTWTFVRALITEADVQAIFMDRSVQKLLRTHAESIGEDRSWLDDIFGGPTARRRPLITHEPGHKTHLHVRFYNPVAQETGRRMYPLLIKHKKISPPTYYVKYKVKRGDTLGRIARRFKTTVKALKKINRLRSSRIYRGRTYKIPRRGGVSITTTPLAIPARRLPPAKVAPDLPKPGDETPAQSAQ